jgi:hypothetical protein
MSDTPGGTKPEALLAYEVEDHFSRFNVGELTFVIEADKAVALKLTDTEGQSIWVGPGEGGAFTFAGLVPPADTDKEATDEG